MMRLAGHSFFNSLADACPPKLRSLQIEPRRAPISENTTEEYYCEQENEEDNEAVKTILRMSRIDVYLRDLPISVASNVEAFMDGYDQKGYDKLMNIYY